MDLTQNAARSRSGRVLCNQVRFPISALVSSPPFHSLLQTIRSEGDGDLLSVVRSTHDGTTSYGVASSTHAIPCSWGRNDGSMKTTMEVDRDGRLRGYSASRTGQPYCFTKASHYGRQMSPHGPECEGSQVCHSWVMAAIHTLQGTGLQRTAHPLNNNYYDKQPIMPGNKLQ